MVGVPTADIATEIDRFVAVLEETKHQLSVGDRLKTAEALLCDAARKHAPILICGNGGSACDAEHITAELVGRFHSRRPPINAICLSSNAAVVTAWANDVGYEAIFARQVRAHATEDSVLICISTSGNSENVVCAAVMARELGIPVISLTGSSTGRLQDYSDVVLRVASHSTAMIQQGHQVIYHHLCAVIEEAVSSSST